MESNLTKDTQTKSFVNPQLIEKTKKDRQPLVILFGIVLFGAIFLVNYFCTLSCDDIVYSLSTGTIPALIKSALNQGSGRLIGNFLGYLVRYHLFTTIEKTVVWFGIITLFTKLIGSKNYIVNAIIAAVLIYPCDKIFAQAYAWNAGFQNYVVPVFIMLLCIYLIKTAAETDNSGKRTLCYIAMLVASFAGQFFSENSSIAVVILAVFMLIYSIVCNKKSLLFTVTYLLTTVAGFVTMMVYPRVLGTNEKIAYYRNYADSISSLFSIATKNFGTIAKEFISYFALWIVISVAFFWMINRVLSKKYEGKVWSGIFLLSKLVLILYPVFGLCYELLFEDTIRYPRYYLAIALCGALIAYIAVLLFTSVMIFVTKSVNKQYKLSAVLMILAMMTMAPLLVVSPIGARTFYLSFVLAFMSGMCVFKNIVEGIKLKKSDSTSDVKVFYACAALLCCLLSVLVMAEVDNKYCNYAREDYILSVVTEDTESVVLPYLPHQNIIHADGHLPAFKSLIKRLTGNKTVEMEFIEWNKWYFDYYKAQNN